MNPDRPKRCLVCRATRREIQLHHITYENLGNERYSDVIALCKLCHDNLHKWLKRRGLTIYSSLDAVAFLRSNKFRRKKRD